MTDFSSTGTLPDHYEQLAKTVRDFAQSVVAPVAAKHDEEHSFPYEVVAGMADMGCSACRSPRSTAAWAATTSRCAWRSRNSARSTRAWRSRWRPGCRWARCPCTASATRSRSRSGCRCLASGKALGAFGLTEAGGGSDAGATKTTAQDRTGQLGHQRQQAVHHQLRHRHHQAGDRHRGHRRSRWQEGDLVDPGAGAHRGFTAEPAYNKVGWNASDTHPLSFDDVRVPAGEPARRARPRVCQLPAHPRRGPHRDRRAVGRRGAGLRGRKREVRQGARRVRPRDRHQPGHRVQDRPDGGPCPRRPHRLLRRRRTDVVGQAVQEGRPRSPSWWPARPRWTTRATPPRSSAATAS